MLRLPAARAMTLLVGIVVVGGAAPISGAQLDDAAAIHEQLPAELEQAVKFRATFGLRDWRVVR